MSDEPLTNRDSPPSAGGNAGAGDGVPVRRIARNSAVTLVASGVQTVMTIGVVALLTRSMPKEDVGLYFLVMVAAVVLQLVLDLGVSSMIVVRVSQAFGAGQPRDAWKPVAGEASALLMAVVGLSLLIPLVAGGVWFALNGETRWLVLAASVAVGCAGLNVQQYGFGLFRAFERFEFEALSKVLQSVGLLAIVATLAALGRANAETASQALAASYLIGGLFCVVVIEAKWPFGRPTFRPGLFRDWLGDAAPLGAGMLMRRMTLQIDNVLLALLQPAGVLALYNVALRPLGPLNLAPQALAGALFPFLARSAQEGGDGQKTALTHCLRLFVLAAVPVIAVVWLFATPIVLVLGGENYAEAAAPMRVLVAILLFTFPSALFRNAFTANGQQRLYATLVGVTLALQIVLETVLILAIGYLGASYGFLIGEAFFLAAGAIACRRLGLVGPWVGRTMRAVPAAAALGAGLWFCRTLPLHQQTVAAAVAVPVYFVLCTMFGAVTALERRALASIITRRGGRRGVRGDSADQLNSPATIARSTS